MPLQLESRALGWAPYQTKEVGAVMCCMFDEMIHTVFKQCGMGLFTRRPLADRALCGAPGAMTSLERMAVVKRLCWAVLRVIPGGVWPCMRSFRK